MVGELLISDELYPADCFIARVPFEWLYISNGEKDHEAIISPHPGQDRAAVSKAIAATISSVVTISVGIVWNIEVQSGVGHLSLE